MKKEIASLKVYLTDCQDIPSHLVQTAPKTFELSVNPLVDEKILELYKREGKITGNTTDLMQNIVAHELGHFVAFMTRCKTHSLEAATMRPITVNGEAGVQVVNPQAEMRAWTLAGRMIGDKLNTELRDVTTASYVLGKPVVI
jgi:hypothetical protein